MRKLKLIAAALIFSVTFSSCHSNNDDQLTCEQAMEATAKAETDFNAGTDVNHEALCNAYKKKLQEEINTCGDVSGGLQSKIDDLGDCKVDVNTGVISVKVGTLQKTFEANITVTNVGTTRKFRAEDEGTSDYISFEIQQGVTGAGAISNFKIHLISSDYIPLPVDEGGNWSSNITSSSATAIDGTFFGYVTSPTTNADLELNLGIIDINL